MNLKLVVLLCLGIWIGLVLGLSFIEAPLKFQAPNITLELGLGIGKLVFGVLNKVELVLGSLLLFWVFRNYAYIDGLRLCVYLSIIGIVLLQNLWFGPYLAERAERIIDGIEVQKSFIHLYYIILEVSKVVLLIVAFIQVFHHERH